VSKNGVNTCHPILEYEIINAPKFSAVMMPFPTINAPNLVTDNLNLNNSDPILLQILRNPQLPQTDIFHFNRTSAILPLQGFADGLIRMFVQTAISTLFAHRQYDRYRTLPMDRPRDPA